MRLKQNRLTEYQHRKAILARDSEGGSYTEYGPAETITAEMWTGGGKMQAEMYGNRLPNIRNLRLQGKYKEVPGMNGKVSYQLDNGPEIAAGDGICIYAAVDQEPDYQIVSIYPYTYLTLEVEKR
ncbi:hypothetical protein PMF13cell1_05646 [Blautia producta]|uniref:Uncharacterized protein n=1 Tax=Blautia producta TaxID=33035 RepID=A0A4P6M5I0_9FIRM|nr:hypothetical protein [Blautia producta]QBF00050.1 hypothetical protein PMF13cell1_05646 [Blautia producta]